MNLLFNVLLITIIGATSFFLGSEMERTKQITKYNEVLKEQTVKFGKLKDDANNLELDLKNAKESHDKVINDLQRTHANRMRESEKRAAFYMQQAKGSSVEQYNLASHAARLDKSLSEGKTLAREFRQTLELRELQIESLAEELLNTRKYINEE